MKGLFRNFAHGAVMAAGSVVGTLVALNAMADLSNPVKRAKIKKKLVNITDAILRK